MRIAYFQRQALPHLDPGADPQIIPAVPGREVEQWDALIASTDPTLFILAAHAADGTLCGAPEAAS